LKTKLFFLIGLMSCAVFSQRADGLLNAKAATDMKDPEIIALKKAIIRNRKDNPDSAVVKANIVYKLALKSNDKAEIVAAAKDLAQSYQSNIKAKNHNEMFGKSVHYMNLAIKVEKTIKKPNKVPLLYRSFGIMYYVHGHIDRALQCYREGLKYTETGDQQYCLLLNSIGNSYVSAKRYQEAIPYFEKCIFYTLKNKDQTYLKSYYETLASVQILTDPEQAKKTLDIGRKVTAKDSPGIDNHYTLLYSTYYLKIKDYEKAERYGKEALENSFKNDNLFQIIPAYMALSELKLAVGDYKQAHDFAQKALDLGKQNGWFISLKPITDLLLKIYKIDSKNKLPFELFELHSLINDSISRNSIIEYELRNSFENKILQDSIKTANQRKIVALRYNQRLEKQRSVLWTAIGITGLLLILTIYIFKNYKHKQKINRIISKENILLAEQKQEVQNHVIQLLGVVESARDFIAYSQDELAFSYINKAGKKLLQLSDVVMWSYEYADIFDKKTLKLLRKTLKISRKKGFYSGEANIKLINGTAFPILLNIVCYKDDDGNVKQYSMIARDITYLKTYQNEITQQNIQLQKVNSELDHFVYSISHDLRAPLISVVGVLDIIETEFYLDDADLHSYLAMLHLGLMRTDDSIKNILQYSKNSRESVRVERVVIRAMVEEEINSFHSELVAKQIELTIEIDDHIPFYNDSMRIKTVLNNLVDNAIKFQDVNKKNKKILVKFISNEQHCSLMVWDNGIGIETDLGDKIFEMFYRGSSQSAGSGLGLYIVKQIADLLEAQIFTKTVYQEMTAVTVVFPNLNPKKQQHETEYYADR